jgi:hypothetical protein
MRKHFPDYGLRCGAAARTGKTLVKARLELTTHSAARRRRADFFLPNPCVLPRTRFVFKT